MYRHDEMDPVEPRVFVEQTRRELIKILKKRDPVWVPRLKNFIELQEGAAFKYGFFMGAILSAVASLLILLITRI